MSRHPAARDRRDTYKEGLAFRESIQRDCLRKKRDERFPRDGVAFVKINGSSLVAVETGIKQMPWFFKYLK